MPSIFISCASEDREHVSRLVVELVGRGFTIHVYNPEHLGIPAHCLPKCKWLKPDEDYKIGIASLMYAADHRIVCVSKNYFKALKKQVVCNEAEFALTHNGRFLWFDKPPRPRSIFPSDVDKLKSRLVLRQSALAPLDSFEDPEVFFKKASQLIAAPLRMTDTLSDIVYLADRETQTNQAKAKFLQPETFSKVIIAYGDSDAVMDSFGRLLATVWLPLWLQNRELGRAELDTAISRLREWKGARPSDHYSTRWDDLKDVEASGSRFWETVKVQSLLWPTGPAGPTGCVHLHICAAVWRDRRSHKALAGIIQLRPDEFRPGQGRSALVVTIETDAKQRLDELGIEFQDWDVLDRLSDLARHDLDSWADLLARVSAATEMGAIDHILAEVRQLAQAGAPVSMRTFSDRIRHIPIGET